MSGCSRQVSRLRSTIRTGAQLPGDVRLLDLPSHGRVVQMCIVVRRFRCVEPSCGRRIFAEPLGDAVAGRSARRTSRLETIVHHLGVALGGRPAAALARRLMLPVSKDTLLRVVRRKAIRDTSPLRVIGIDDWAWKRGQRYGSIICDLERRRVVDLLPDREPATVEAWLSHHPEITVISRDRGGGYGQEAAYSERAAAPGRSSRRSLAPDGERQRCFPGGRAAIDEAHSYSAGQHCHRPDAADPCRAPAARRLPAPRGGLRHHPRPGQSRHAHQRDRASNRSQPKAGTRYRAWRRG